MERFKACEKEMKTKAFSKEGLIAAARLDPAEKAKVDMANWISSQVDELSRQVEASEAEIETMQVAGGKKKKAGGAGASAERAAVLEELNERRSWHIGRLEILHRMLENGSLEPEKVGEIKEDISYFVESNGDEDFDEDEGIYDEFELDEQEEAFGLKDNDEAQSSHDGVSVAEEPAPPVPSTKAAPAKDGPGPKRRESEQEQPAATSSIAKKAPQATARKASDSSTRPATLDPSKAPPVPPANFPTAKPSASAAPASPTNALSPSKAAASTTSAPAPASTVLPPIRYAAAAAAAVGPTSAASSQPPSAVQAPSPVEAPTDASDSVTAASPAPSHAPSQQTNLSADDTTVSTAPSSGPAAPPGLARTQSPAVNGTGSNDSAKASPSATHSSIRQGSTVQDSPLVEHVGAPGSRADGSTAPAAAAAAASQAAPSATVQQGPFQAASLAGSSGAAAAVQPSGGAPAAIPGGPSSSAKGTPASEVRLPSSLADLVTSFESAKLKSLHRGEDNMSALHKSLEASFMNVPEALDSEKPKYYVPKNPYPTPSYYPQAPTAIFDNPSIYSKFDEDTLFYIFYYQQGTYHQYLAARELKKQSWRFHKQFLTWFRRHSEPQAITDEYEQGVYVYFDWEGSWTQRKKSDFRFEYRWLEDV